MLAVSLLFSCGGCGGDEPVGTSFDPSSEEAGGDDSPAGESEGEPSDNENADE